jgi:arylsulfatase A-like enzyme
MIAWAPGRIPAGRTSDHVWGMWDLLPTLAALAGAPAPRDVDGLSMVRALTGRGTPPQHAWLYWEFYEQGSAQAVRMGRWKAVRKPMLTGPIELYDLEADLGERRDVAAAHPDVVARAERVMREAHHPSELWKPQGAPPRQPPVRGSAAASAGR